MFCFVGMAIMESTLFCLGCLLPCLSHPAGGSLGLCSALSAPPTFLPVSASRFRGTEICR